MTWGWIFIISQLALLAFLLHVRVQRLEAEPRVTLRDQLAGQAMQGYLSGHIANYGHDNHWPIDGLASEAYGVADAMLKARAANAEPAGEAA